MVNRWKMSKVDAKFERNGIENHRAQMREMKKKMATTRYAKSRPTRSNAVKRQQWWLALAADWPAVVEGVGQTRPLRTRPSPPGPSADGSRMPRLGRHRTPSIRCWPPLHQVLLLLLLLRRRFHSSHATHRDHFFSIIRVDSTSSSVSISSWTRRRLSPFSASSTSPCVLRFNKVSVFPVPIAFFPDRMKTSVWSLILRPDTRSPFSFFMRLLTTVRFSREG